MPRTPHARVSARGFLFGGIAFGAIALGALGWIGCREKFPEQITSPNLDAGGDSGAQSACVACVSDTDCDGGVCTQLGSDSFCAATCDPSGGCGAGYNCVSATSTEGVTASVCVTSGGECGESADSGGPSDTCGTLVGPNVAASCSSCGGANTCQTNGCYGGWYCDTSTSKCHAPPTTCGSTTPGVPIDAGSPVTATIGNTGGTESRLEFAVIGDTRPANVDETSSYPTQIISKIYTRLGGLSAEIPFSISTGDYMFATPSGGQASPQLDIYLGAKTGYSATVFPAMGNHECTGATASNCGQGNVDGITDNFTSFQQKLLTPIGQSNPYYEIDISAPDNSWAAKFLFVAANYWSDAQGTWLDGAMARPTTYTFIVRHESASANTAPGVTPSEAIMAKYPYTLAIVGHTHTYEHSTGSREVIVGNGGAPLSSSSKTYGFALVQQLSDGTLAVDMIAYDTGLADPTFHFIANP